MNNQSIINGLVPRDLLSQYSNIQNWEYEYNAQGLMSSRKDMLYRIKTEYKVNNTLQKTVYYIGNYECEVYPNGRIREINYINTSTGHTIVELKDNKNNISTDSLYYIFKDHLGSYDRITNQLGQIVETYSFDAWGNRRQASDWTIKDTTTTRLFTRGFTGHEHLDAFETINMNGRLYDPTIARFLSPDPYVASNTFTQDYNRYSYCRNNPLLYTDPSGEWALWDDLIVGGVGFATGYISYGITHNDWGWNAVLSGTITAGMFMIGYYSAGAMSMSAGGIANGFSAAGLQSHANTVGLVFAGKSLASNVISSFMPSFSIPIGDKFTLGISPGLGMGANGLVGGISFSGTYSNEENSISLGAGFFGNSYSFGGGFAKEGYGFSYSVTHYGGVHSQLTGTLSLKANDVSFSLENDILAFQGYDRWRTSAFELGIGNFVFGGNIYTNYGEAESGKEPINKKSKIWKENRDDYKAWDNGKVYSSPLWIGYRNGSSITRVGYSHKSFQDLTQNGVHKWVPFGRQNYYLDYSQFRSGLYSYSGTYNPFSLY